MSDKDEENQSSVMEYQPPQIDYERLRDQCLNAMSELETLRRNQAEHLNKCERAAQEADYYRKQYKVTMDKLDQSTKDHQNFKLKYEQILADRDKLRQDYEEIVLLREQEKLETNKPRLNISHTASNEELTLDELKQANEDLKYNFDDLHADHEILLSNQKESELEIMKLKEQLESVVSERDNILLLKQQRDTAICGYENALQKREDTIKELAHYRQQCELTDRDLQQAIRLKMQMSKDIMKLRDERNSALNEYKLVMSERDTVHQEIEKLQDDLKQEKAKTEKIQDEKEKVSLEKEGLRHEVVAVLADRDQAVKEVHDLRNRLHAVIKEKETSVKHLEEQMQDYELLKQERNAAKKERGEAIVHRDKILKECFEVKRLFEKMEREESNETEGLKIQFDKLSNELTNAWNAAEVSMTRRDWAFRERDKVKQELEDLKEDHYELKKTKEVSDSQYSELLKQHEVLRKQYNELYSEFGSYKKIYIENDIKRLRSSQDSALDADAPSYHIESIVLNRSNESEDFGFRIDGGCDHRVSPHDPSIFVVEIVKGSMADGKLRVNDCIIHVNNIDMTSIDFQTANDAINSTNYLNITILRHCKLGVKSPIQRIEIKSNEEKTIGLSIDSGLHIKRIEPGSAASEEETLSIGDKILSVNGQSIENMPYTEAKKLLKTSNLSLTILKPSVSTASSHRSLQNNLEELHESTAESSHHFRSTSAPTYMNAAIPRHTRNSSVLHADHDGSFKSDFKDLYPSDTIRTQRQMYTDDRLLKTIGKESLSDVVNPSGSLVLSPNITKRKETRANPVLSPPDFRRPMSAHGSGKSFSSTSSISNSRFSYDFSRIPPSSPLNISRTDPLALSPRTVGQASSASNTSVNSGGRTSHIKRGRKPFHTTGRNSGYVIQSYHDGLLHHHPITHPRKPLSEVFPAQMNISSSPNTNSLDLRHFGTFPGKPMKFNDELPERLHSHSSISTSKAGSNRSMGNPKSSSSHGSLNSEFSDKGVFNIYDPVDEETSESLLEFSAPNPLSSVRSSGRKKSNPKPVSPTFTLKSKSPKQPRKSITQEEEEPRIIVLEKGQYPLGITIDQGKNNGIFVAGVTEDSIAARKGLRYGDQLLEYNGINLRMASYEQAALILKQSAVESTATVLVQYNLHKMRKTTENSSSTHSTPHVMHRVLPASPLITPRTTPLTKRCLYTPPSTPASFHGRLNSNTSSSSDHSKLTTADLKITSILESGHVGEPRRARIVRDPSSTPLGIGIIGGNAIGIFISDIQKDSLADLQPGLRCGDQILRYNAREMSNCTLEEATLELGKPSEVCDLDVQYNPPGYTKAQFESGDSFYIRALYDRGHASRGELSFRKGDIMRVTDTLYKGQLGVWRAYLVEENNEETVKRHKGKIPSKGTAEQELLLRRTSTYAGDDKLKGRKSLFRRSKKGSHGYAVNHSRESSDSKQGDGVDVLSSSLTSAVSCLFSNEGLLSYQYVKKYDSTYPRPVIVLGALSEPICDKLTIDYQARFSRPLPEIVETTKESLDKNIENGVYLDYKLSRKGDRYECTTLQAIHYVIYEKSKHCILDVNHESLDRFTKLKIHPIILYIKYKSPKHIKDMRDGRFIREKIPSKYAKDVFEQYIRIEKEWKHYFTVTMQAHSLNSICKEISECVTEHQKKTLWISYD